MNAPYRLAAEIEKEDRVEEEKKEEEKELEEPKAPFFSFVVVLFTIEGVICYFLPYMGTLVSSVGFNIVLYSLLRIKHASDLKEEYEAKKKEETSKKQETATKYTRDIFRGLYLYCRRNNVVLEEMIQSGSDDISAKEAGRAAKFFREQINMY